MNRKTHDHIDIQENISLFLSVLYKVYIKFSRNLELPHSILTTDFRARINENNIYV